MSRNASLWRVILFTLGVASILAACQEKRQEVTGGSQSANAGNEAVDAR